MDHEGQGAQGGYQDPTESGNEDAVFYAQVVVLSEKPPQGCSCCKGDPGGNKKRLEIPLDINDGADQRQNHGYAGDQEQGAEHMKDRKRVHAVSSMDI